MISVERSGDVVKFRMARSILGRAVYFTTAYWVDGLLVDTGCAYTVEELVSSLEPLQVHTIVNTHSHEDHVAANAALSRRRGARVLAHPEAFPILARKPRRLHPYQVVMWGYPEPSHASAIPDSIETGHHRFNVIHTPGHSPDHICLHEPEEGWLFCGDAFIGGRDTALREDYDIWQIVASLKKMAALDLRLLFTGSGSIRDNPATLLSEKIRYLEETGEKALALHRQGLGARQIRKRLFGREGWLAYATLGHFSGKHLVRSFLEDRQPRSESPV